LQVVIEGGFDGGRCGVRDVDTALTVAEAVRARAPYLKLAGVGGFEGLLQYRPAAERDGAVRQFLNFLADVAGKCDGLGYFDDIEEVILTAGGSAFYDLVAATFEGARLSRPTRVVIRSGCYLTHDSGLYDRLFEDLLRRDPGAERAGLSFEPALEVWSHVLSTPEPGLVILSAGRRDFGHDAGYPRLVKHARPGRPGTPLDLRGLRGCRVVAVSDQHAHVRVPEGHGFRVGSRSDAPRAGAGQY
jgi:D-serine dehydratase